MVWHSACWAHKGLIVDRAQFPEFYKKNAGLIHLVTKKVTARAMALGSGTIDYDEMEQEMTEVFLRAYDGYDPEKFKFSTYFMRAAFNRANYLLHKVQVERVVNRTKSVEEMGARMGGDDDEDLSMTVEDVTSMGPEDHAQLQSLMRSWHAKLSCVGQMILTLTLEPPEWLIHEFMAQKEFAEISRAQGITRRGRQDLNASFVVHVLKVANPDNTAPLETALDEVRKIARNTL